MEHGRDLELAAETERKGEVGVVGRLDVDLRKRDSQTPVGGDAAVLSHLEVAADDGGRAERQDIDIVSGLDPEVSADCDRDGRLRGRVHNPEFHVPPQPQAGAVSMIEILARQAALEAKIHTRIKAQAELSHDADDVLARMQINAEQPPIHRERLGAGVLARDLGLCRDRRGEADGDQGEGD